MAALQGVGETTAGNIIWLAGGQAKDQTFNALSPLLERYVTYAVLFGETAEALAACCPSSVQVHKTVDLAAAVEVAKQVAAPADAVLLAPACASFDQFQHFVHRGEVFTQLVKQLEDSLG